MRRTFFFVFVSVLSLGWFHSAFAFDVAVYGDARHNINWVTQDPWCRCVTVTDPCNPPISADSARNRMISNIATGAEDSLFKWLEDMGVTHVEVYYPRQKDFRDLQDRPITSMRIMNRAYPLGTWRYVTCQSRDLWPGELDDFRPSNRWVTGHLGEETSIQAPFFAPTQQCLKAEGISPVEMWTPGMIGTWYGWKDRAEVCDSTFQPIHFRITADIDVIPNSPDTIATLYWMFEYKPGDSARGDTTWIQYPGIPVLVDSFDNPGQEFSEIDNSLSAQDMTVVLLNSTHQPIDTVENFSHAFTGSQVSMKMVYHGGHTLYLRRVQVCDEAYWNMFISPDSSDVREGVANDFATEYNLWSGDRSAGWYFDEWDPWNENLEGLVQVNKTLLQRGLPGIITNGQPSGMIRNTAGPCSLSAYGREELYREMDEQGAYIPVHMAEFYLYGGDTCTTYGLTFEYIPTDSNSDAPYVNAEPCSSIVDWCSSGTRTAYSGMKSLQCAIDGSLWGARYFYEHFGLDPSPYDYETVQLINTLVPQVQYIHERGQKFWVLLDKEETYGGYTSYDSSRFSPKPNELKLSAWLSVAVDADGIMWYDWDLERLVDWTVPGADWCGGPGWLCNNSSGLQRGDCYATLKDAHAKIHSISPTLDLLNFEKTYASRAFEHNYGSLGNPKDVLREGPIELGNSEVDFIHTYKWRVAQGQMDPTWVLENADSAYVQVSRFEMPGADADDHWFLIVNRRALANTIYGEARDKRRVELGISNVADTLAPYFVEKRIANTREFTTEHDGHSGRSFKVELEPGDAELVHFYKADTSDLVITTPTTIQAPAYFARNIVISDSGKLKIVPNTDALEHSIIVNGDTIPRWDSVATVTFWKGKGITVKSTLANSNALRILGSDSIRIRPQPAIPEDSWKGIYCDMDNGDTLDLKYTDVVGAGIGLSIAAGGTSKYSLDHCRFRENSTAILGQSTCTIGLSDCDVYENGRGLVFSQGVVANITGGSISQNAERCLRALNNCTVNLSGVEMNDNGTSSGTGVGPGGILSNFSSLRAKCMQVMSNIGAGIDISGGSVIMSDPQTPYNEPRWGGNRIFWNSAAEIKCSNLSDGFVFQHGLNQIFDSTAGIPFNPDRDAWIYIRDDDGNWPVLDYRSNYWGGADSATIADRVEPDAPFMPVWTDSEFCNLSPQEGDEECIVQAARKEEEQLYSVAKANYKEIIEAPTTDCGKKPSIDRLLAVDFLGGFSNDSTRAYLKSIADTTLNPGLKQAAQMGIAFSWIKASQDDSARTVFNGILANNDLFSNPWIDAKAGLLTLEMSEAQVDTTNGGLSPEALIGYLDSLEQIYALRNVWTQYYISDSVVMYAPCRVDSQIHIDEGGSLTILPQPGIKHPVVEFTRAGAIYVDGWPSGYPAYLPRGALYVQGTADNPITLDWTNVTEHSYCDLYSILGRVVMKHAHLVGGSFMNSNDAPWGCRLPILQADSCTFESFEEGMWVWGLNDSSYIRNCTFRDLGWNGRTIGVGVGLLAMETNHLQVENCTFEDNPIVGVMLCAVNDADVTNAVVTRSGEHGIYQWDGNLTLECAAVTDNGDTLPELWVEGGTVDLVGGHNEFADSSGTLIHVADPSYIDLEEGENALHLWTENGRYLESGDTSDTWDVTWNNWSPAVPTDPDFYDYLYPHNPAKWTVDSSLVDFVACDQGSIESFGPGSWLIVGQEEHQGGIYSHGGEQETPEASLAGTASGVKHSKGFQGKQNPSLESKRSLATKSGGKTHIDAIRQHHEELAKWRAFKDVTKTADKRTAQRMGMEFVDEHPSSTLIPAALARLASLADQDDTSVQVSTYLSEQAKRLPEAKDRTLAKRLSCKAMAKEGRPSEALHGLEECMETAVTPRDSIRALVDAMNVYFFNRRQPGVDSRYPFVKNDDIKELGRRLISLARIMDDPNLTLAGRGTPVPQEYKLYQNYPNPFNPVTEIRFDIPEVTRVELKVFNILGQEVATLLDEARPAGAYRVQWDSRSASGATVSSGVYIYQLKAGNFTDSKKMVLLR
jgi:hypothetical protein